MPRFGRFAHQMQHALILWYIKIAINLHAPIVRVRRHRIPNAAILQDRKTHHQLTTQRAIGVNIFINSALISRFRCPQMRGRRLRLTHQNRWISMMCRGRKEEKTGRIVRIIA